MLLSSNIAAQELVAIFKAFSFIPGGSSTNLDHLDSLLSASLSQKNTLESKKKLLQLFEEKQQRQPESLPHDIRIHLQQPKILVHSSSSSSPSEDGSAAAFDVDAVSSWFLAMRKQGETTMPWNPDFISINNLGQSVECPVVEALLQLRFEIYFGLSIALSVLKISLLCDLFFCSTTASQKFSCPLSILPSHLVSVSLNSPFHILAEAFHGTKWVQNALLNDILSSFPSLFSAPFILFFEAVLSVHWMILPRNMVTCYCKWIYTEPIMFIKSLLICFVSLPTYLLPSSGLAWIDFFCVFFPSQRLICLETNPVPCSIWMGNWLLVSSARPFSASSLWCRIFRLHQVSIFFQWWPRKSTWIEALVFTNSLGTWSRSTGCRYVAEHWLGIGNFEGSTQPQRQCWESFVFAFFGWAYERTAFGIGISFCRAQEIRVFNHDRIWHAWNLAQATLWSSQRRDSAHL